MRVVLFGLAAVIACADHTAQDSAAATKQDSARVSATLVDSQNCNFCQDAPYYKVLVRAGVPDTIRGLWTTDRPIVIGDTIILGTIADTNATRLGFYRYSIPSRKLDTLGITEAYRTGLSDLVISPDGRYFTWGSFDGAGHAAAEIHRFPSGELVSRSQSQDVGAGDGPSVIGKWNGPSEALVHIWAELDKDKPWLRFRWSASTNTWTMDAIRNGQ